MKESEIVEKFLQVKEQAASVGITLKATMDKFSISDIPKASGIIVFNTIEEVSTFVYGYEHGYKSGL